MPAARAGLTDPALKVVVRSADGKELAQAGFSAPQNGRCYGTSPHLGTVFTLPAAEVQRLRVQIADLLQK